MNIVEPIRNKRDIERMKQVLSGRDRLLFIIGINSGLRVSDLLPLTVGDLRGKTAITLREQKTGKAKQFRFNSAIVSAVNELLPADAPASEFAFKSRKGANQPISRVQAYRVLNDAAERAGVDVAIGTHTLRKTFGYHAYKAGVDLAVLQAIFNHSSQAVTLRYIGITQDTINDVYAAVTL